MKIPTASSLRAFTLVETLVSIFIITTVIVGPLSVAMSASSYARQTKDVMAATYLAQEASELLHHMQDSIYLKCVNDISSNSVCVPIDYLGSGVYETPGETAWRVFKSQLVNGYSCFSAAGCTYDFLALTTNENVTPTKYVPGDGNCDTLALNSDAVYACATSGASTGTTFNRLIKLELVPTFSAADGGYNDDIRATITVSFRQPNGYAKTVKLVDFLHARP